MSTFLPTDLDKYEELLTDERVEQIRETLTAEFGVQAMQDLELATCIQPWKEVEVDRDGIKVPVTVQPMAIFLVLSPHPRKYAAIKKPKVMTHGTASLAAFREAQAEASHYTGAPDSALIIFRRVVQEHLKTIQNLKELI